MKALVLALVASVALISGAAQAQVVETAAGKLKGTTGEGVSAFLGVPYAAPPVGENRWRAPQPVEPWDGVRDASKFVADCAHEPFPPNLLPGLTAPKSEDCLFVNIWRPEDARKGDALPVMVWVHGGGLVNGGTSTPVYSGESFARNGIVFVSLNYRLARLGFFAHEALRDEGIGGNFGWLDQIAALQWVRDNITSFGGNPDEVTIFGESAGGRSIHMLLQSPLARGLYHRAIIQSGGGRARWQVPTVAEATLSGNRFAPGMNADEIRAIPVEDLIGIQPQDMFEGGTYSGPMIDGQTDLGEAIVVARAGLYPDVPIMLGANSADGSFPNTDKEKVFASFGDKADAARALYDPDGTASGVFVGTQVTSDRGQVEPARAMARELAAQGNNQVYLFRFAHNGTTSGVEMGGAPHASEIPYVFNQEKIRLQLLDTGHDAEVADLTHAYWVNFAKTGNPNGKGLPEWPAATPDTTTVQMIGTEGTAHVEDPLTERLNLCESLIGE